MGVQYALADMTGYAGLAKTAPERTQAAGKSIEIKILDSLECLTGVFSLYYTLDDIVDTRRGGGRLAMPQPYIVQDWEPPAVKGALGLVNTGIDCISLGSVEPPGVTWDPSSPIPNLRPSIVPGFVECLTSLPSLGGPDIRADIDRIITESVDGFFGVRDCTFGALI